MVKVDAKFAKLKPYVAPVDPMVEGSTFTPVKDLVTGMPLVFAPDETRPVEALEEKDGRIVITVADGEFGVDYLEMLPEDTLEVAP